MTISTARPQRLAHIHVEAWIEDELTPSPVPVRAVCLDRTGLNLCTGPHTVGVVSYDGGFIVNPYGPSDFLGPDILPVSESGLGLIVASPHPETPGWVDTVKPALFAAVREATALVVASVDGRLCGDPNPDAPEKYAGDALWSCRREAGHTSRDGWRGHHAMTGGRSWDQTGMALTR